MAQHHLSARQKTMAPIIVITGRSRSGKSRLAKDLQERFAASNTSYNANDNGSGVVATSFSQDSFRVPKGPQRDAAGLPLLYLRLNDDGEEEDEVAVAEIMNAEHYNMTRWDDLWDTVIDAALLSKANENITNLVFVEGYSLALDVAGLKAKLKLAYGCQVGQTSMPGVTWLYLRDPALDGNFEVFKSRRRDVPGVKGNAHLQWLCCDEYCQHAWNCGSAYEKGAVCDMIDEGEMREVIVPNHALDGNTAKVDMKHTKQLPDPKEWDIFVGDVAQMIRVLGA